LLQKYDHDKIECNLINTKEELNVVLLKKTIPFLTMLLLLGTILAACGSEDNTDGTQGSNDTPDDSDSSEFTLVEDGKFTFAASGEFKPFSYADPEDPKKMVGFDIAVGEAIAEELGLEPNPQKYKFASIVAGVKSNRFDAAIASHTITDDRLAEVNFSTPYYYSGPQIFVRPDSDVETVDDLTDKEIAVSKGSTYAKTAEEYTDNIAMYDSDVVALQALSEGRHDVVITDFITGALAIQSGFEIEAKERLGESEQAVAVSKENEPLLEAINEALETLRENGTLAELSEEWIGNDITSTQQ
jgi:polar amino acid transport system substrate-binding protein